MHTQLTKIVTYRPPKAVDREFNRGYREYREYRENQLIIRFSVFSDILYFFIGILGLGRHLKSFLAPVGFILAESQPIPLDLDPIHPQNYKKSRFWHSYPSTFVNIFLNK